MFDESLRASFTVAKEPEPRVERTVNWFRWTIPPSESNSSEAWVVERTWEVFFSVGFVCCWFVLLLLVVILKALGDYS